MQTRAWKKRELQIKDATVERNEVRRLFSPRLHYAARVRCSVSQYNFASSKSPDRTYKARTDTYHQATARSSPQEKLARLKRSSPQWVLHRRQSLRTPCMQRGRAPATPTQRHCLARGWRSNHLPSGANHVACQIPQFHLNP